MKKFAALLAFTAISLIATQAIAGKVGGTVGSTSGTKAAGAAGGAATTLQLMCVYQTGIRTKSVVFAGEDPFEPIYVTIAMGSYATTCPSTYNGYNLTSFYWAS